jgi:hypothetical protein
MHCRPLIFFLFLVIVTPVIYRGALYLSATRAHWILIASSALLISGSAHNVMHSSHPRTPPIILYRVVIAANSRSLNVIVSPRTNVRPPQTRIFHMGARAAGSIDAYLLNMWSGAITV